MPERPALNFRLSRTEWILLVLALILRLAYAAAAPKIDPFLVKKGELYGDAQQYDNAAWNLATRGEMPSDWEVHRAPMYSIGMAGVYVVAGHSPMVVRLLHAVGGTLAILWFFVCFRHIFGQRASLWFLGLAAIQPQLLQIIGWIYSENLALPLLGFLFYLHCRSLVDGFTPGRLVGLGLVLGVLTLTRPTFLLFTLLYAIWLVAKLPAKRKATGFASVLVFCFLVVAPWTVRNYNVYGGFIPVAMDGHSLAMANNPISEGSAVQPLQDEDFRMEFQGRSQLEIDQLWRSYAVEWIKENPVEEAENITKKYALTVSPLGYSEAGKQTFDLGRIKLVADILFFLYLTIVFCGRRVRDGGLDAALFWVTLVLGLASAVAKMPVLFVPFVVFLGWGYVRNWRPVLGWLVPCTLLLALTVVVMTVFNGASRYMLPLAPFLLGLFCAVIIGWKPEQEEVAAA